MVGMEDGILPHLNSFNEPSEIEEERRLCYVGITRAKERLYLTNAKRRLLYGNETCNPPSRFIDEIDNSLLERSELEKESIKINHKKLYNNDDSYYEVGEVVNHMTFGRGVVVGVDDRFVSIAFNKRFGIKKFLKNYTGLKKGR